MSYTTLGYGCGTPAMTKRSRYPREAYRLGKSLRTGSISIRKVSVSEYHDMNNENKETDVIHPFDTGYMSLYRGDFFFIAQYM